MREATVLQRVSASDLDIEVEIARTPDHSPVDRRLVAQAVTNLVKNAREAIETCEQNDEPGRERARSRSRPMERRDGRFSSNQVTDNGLGLPMENRHSA